MGEIILKILVRCGILPYENVSVEEVIKFDSIGTNSGNLLISVWGNKIITY